MLQISMFQMLLEIAILGSRGRILWLEFEGILNSTDKDSSFFLSNRPKEPSNNFFCKKWLPSDHPDKLYPKEMSFSKIPNNKL